MSKVGSRLIAAAKEARSIAKGYKTPPKIDFPYQEQQQKSGSSYKIYDSDEHKDQKLVLTKDQINDLEKVVMDLSKN